MVLRIHVRGDVDVKTAGWFSGLQDPFEGALLSVLVTGYGDVMGYAVAVLTQYVSERHPIGDLKGPIRRSHMKIGIDD
jgi:hypothetical protein